MPAKQTEPFRYVVPAVEKAFAILELFVEDNREYAMSEVSKIVSLPISTTSSLLQTLHRCGYLSRNPKRKYRLTTRLLTEANKMVANLQVGEVAHRELRKLTQEIGFTSVLAVLDGDQLTYIDKIDGTGEIKLNAQIGRRMYLHACATGKMLMSHLPPEKVDQVIASVGLPALTENTITSPEALKEELAATRKRGYAIDNEESIIGVRSVAAPVFNHTGNVEAVIGMGATIFEVEGSLKQIIEKVTGTAGRISEQLGYSPAANNIIRARRRASPPKGPRTSPRLSASQ
ncbi:MAG: IclR family transcriptional regulator [Acidobacteriota bacterium]